jgi:hypothetical protein
MVVLDNGSRSHCGCVHGIGSSPIYHPKAIAIRQLLRFGAGSIRGSSPLLETKSKDPLQVAELVDAPYRNTVRNILCFNLFVDHRRMDRGSN